MSLTQFETPGYRCSKCGRFKYSDRPCKHCLLLWDPRRDVKGAVAEAVRRVESNWIAVVNKEIDAGWVRTWAYAFFFTTVTALVSYLFWGMK